MSEQVAKTPIQSHRNGESASVRQELLDRAKKMGVKPFTSLEEFAGDEEFTADLDVDKFLRQIRQAVALTLLVICFVLLPVSGNAQDRKSPTETAEDLRTQLSEVQAKEAELQARVKQLEEDLKPENIERYFAGVGSTRPEDLRALRKSQLDREKTSVQRQLELLAQRRARLETAILKADSAAYQQSAQGPASDQQGGQASSAGDQQIAQGPSTTEPLLAAQTTAIPRWLIPLAGIIALVSVGFLIVVIRKVRRA